MSWRDLDLTFCILLRFSVFGVCSFGNNCSQAHSEEELCEWRERFEERKKELIRQKEEAQDSSSYIEKLLEKLMKALNQETVVGGFVNPLTKKNLVFYLLVPGLEKIRCEHTFGLNL